MKRFNVENVEIIHTDSTKIKLRCADKILIDAPCTNTGNIAKDPALRIILRNEENIKLDKYVEVQKKLIENCLNLRVNDYIVYSTCSIIPDEGEVIFDELLKKNEIVMLPTGKYGNPGFRGFICSSKVTRFLPHLNRTIGFFVAKFSRIRK